MSLSEAYDRDGWGDQMGPFLSVRDLLRSAELRYEYLDAAQLLKHAFGLVTEGKRTNKRTALVYLFVEPDELGGEPIDVEAIWAHLGEVVQFAAEV